MDPIIAPSLLVLLSAFSECFTAPSFDTFRHVVGGWLLCIGRRHVSTIIEAADAVGHKHHTSFQRFFRAARWDADAVGLVVLRLVMKLATPDTPLLLAVDTRWRGTPASASHRRAITATRSCRRRPRWPSTSGTFGSCSLWSSRWSAGTRALPCRSSYACTGRTKGLQSEWDWSIAKKTVLAVEMLAVLRAAVPSRDLVVVGDNGYANREVLTVLSRAYVFHRARHHGRCRLRTSGQEAAEHQRPQKPVKGARLPSPKELAANPRAKWQTITATIYGELATVRVIVFDALWHKGAGKGAYLRFVIVRGWPGHDKRMMC